MAELYRLDFSSGKSYVGISTKGARKRLIGHAADVRRGKKTLVCNAWREFGPPELIIISVIDDSKIFEAESLAIDQFNTMSPNGYNMIPGGIAKPGLVPEIAKRISESSKGKIFSDATKAKLSESLKKRMSTQESREKFSKLFTGKELSESHKSAISLSKIGSKLSDDTKAKISIALKASHLKRNKKVENG